MTEKFKDWDSIEPFDILEIEQNDPNKETQPTSIADIIDTTFIQQHVMQCLPLRIDIAKKNAQKVLPRYLEARTRSYTSDVLNNVRTMSRLREIQMRSARILSSTEENDNQQKPRLQKKKQGIPHIIISSKKRDQKRNVTPARLMNPIEARTWMKEASMLATIHAGYTISTKRCIDIVVDVGIKFISQLGILLKKEMGRQRAHEESPSTSVVHDAEYHLQLAMSKMLRHIGSGPAQLQDHLFQLAHYGKALRRLDSSLLKAMGPRLEADQNTNTNLNAVEIQAMSRIPQIGAAYLFEHLEANGKSSKQIKQHFLTLQHQKKCFQSNTTSKKKLKSQSAKQAIIRGGAITNKDAGKKAKSRKAKQKQQIKWRQEEDLAIQATKMEHKPTLLSTSEILSQPGITQQRQPFSWSQDIISPCFGSRHGTTIPSVSHTEEMLDLSNLGDLFTTPSNGVEDLLPPTTF